MVKINKLTIELVPETCHYTNVRSNVSKKTWDFIRKKAYKEANYHCEVCGQSGIDQGFRHPVECHERWHYDDTNHIQKLIKFIALCPMCHKVKHIGLAEIKGEYNKVFNHFIMVNKLKSKRKADIMNYIEKVKHKTRRRSKHYWRLDISYIKEYIKIKDDIFDVLKKKRNEG